MTPAPKDPEKYILWIERCRNSHKGKLKSDIHRKHMSEVKLGHIVSEKTREKLSEIRLGWKGKMSEETKIKLSLAQTGKKRSEETRKKMSLAKKGKNHPNFGKPLSIDTKNKMSLSGVGKHVGEKSGNWKGGLSFEPYCPKFNEEFKERVRKFFGYQCQICGHLWHEGERKLAVHHVNFDKQTCCNTSIPLFVPLCHGSCHTKTNHNRIFWQYWFTEMINRLYNGQCYLLKLKKER